LESIQGGSIAKYAYPAVFHPEKEGGCAQGDSLEDGMETAEDALWLMLYGNTIGDKATPTPSAAREIETEGNDIVAFIKCDPMDYRRFCNSSDVKMSLGIPNWLDVEVEKAGINFSATPQDALKERLRL
jgi:predicted RNase H-like HicB family nuclease